MFAPKYSRAQSCAYHCSKNVLVALNALYIFLAVVLIGVAVYAKVTSVVTSLPILGGVITCGVFLLIVALCGMIGAVKHSQVILFFYMIIMLLLFIIQLSVSIGALAITSKQQEKLLEVGWGKLDNSTKSKIQAKKDCCGFSSKYMSNITVDGKMFHPSCEKLQCCQTPHLTDCSQCSTCYGILKDAIDHWIKVSGGVALFFSFTLLFGVYISCRLRNTKDPRSNPSQFL